MEQTIRVLNLNKPTRYYGRELQPKRRVDQVTPFKDQRAATRAVAVIRRQCGPGDTIEVGLFPPERVSSEQPWTPFEKAVCLDNNPILEDKIGKPDSIWMNSRYTVFVYEALTGEGWPPMWHLSIKRNDKEVIRDWRELQRIKNELIGPDHEAVELFPAESRLVDTANQYHLFVLKLKGQIFPFGWTTRLTQGDEVGNAKQRPFERKNDGGPVQGARVQDERGPGVPDVRQALGHGAEGHADGGVADLPGAEGRPADEGVVHGG